MNLEFNFQLMFVIKGKLDELKMNKDLKINVGRDILNILVNTRKIYYEVSFKLKHHFSKQKM